MQFKRQTTSNVDVNLTPLIDVVFLLLIFFMVSTTFTKESHLELNLPDADGKEVAETPVEPIEIVISSNGTYAVNGKGLVNNQLGTIQRAIQEFSGPKRDLPITITADADASHQAVIRAMDAAGQLGFTQLSITTNDTQPGN